VVIYFMVVRRYLATVGKTSGLMLFFPLTQWLMAELSSFARIHVR